MSSADFTLRYFTRAGIEVIFCGHSTVGALYMLALEKCCHINGEGHYDFTVETAAGLINMGIDINQQEQITVRYQTPEIKLVSSTITHQQVSDALGIPLDFIDTRYPIDFEQTNKDMFVVINNLEAMGKIEINQRSATAFAKQHDIVCFCCMTKETFDKKNQLHTRSFAPAVGIPEDPFTGSILGGLAMYALRHKLIPKKTKTIHAEQGHFIDRPGQVELQIHQQKDNIEVEVLAKAIHFYSTEVQL